MVVYCDEIPVTVRNFADNAWGWRASVPSLGPSGAAEKVTRLADLGLRYAFTFTPPGVEPSAKSGGCSGARSLSGEGAPGLL